jgi:anthranilate synthase component 1
VLRPTRDEFRALARDHTVVPVWREVLADLTTPVAAFLRIVGDEPGFLLESVEHGERWGRWSFVGRRPAATFVARDGKVEVDATVDASIRLDEGILAALEDVLRVYRTPQLADLPPLHRGVLGYWGYDVVREIERLPDVPPDHQHVPDAVFSIISELAAYDHLRQRAVLIANAWVNDGVDLDQAYDDAVARLDDLAAAGARSLDEPMIDPPTGDDPLPEVRSSMGDGA